VGSALGRHDGSDCSHNSRMQMRDEAQRYCSLIERAGSMEQRAFVVALAASLASLLSAASHLPDVEPTETELPDGPDEDQRRACFTAVQQTLGDWADYWTTLATHGEDASEAVLLPLADDLTDVWRDLKQGLLALDAGALLDDVTWEWRFGFYTHWGRHATEALRAVHSRLADEGGPTRHGD
jgi:Domain of unknown function (DUF5063)